MPWINAHLWPYLNMPGFNQQDEWKRPSWLNRFNQYGLGNNKPGYWKDWYNKNPFLYKNDPLSFYPPYASESWMKRNNQDIQTMPWDAGSVPQSQKGMANKLAYDARFIFPNYNQGGTLTDNQALQVMPNIITGADAQAVWKGAAARKPVEPNLSDYVNRGYDPNSEESGIILGNGGRYPSRHINNNGEISPSKSELDAYNDDMAKYQEDLAAYNSAVGGLGSAEAKRLENESIGYFSMPGVGVDWSQGLGGITKNNYLQQFGPDFVNQGPLTYPYQGSASVAGSTTDDNTDSTGNPPGCTTDSCGGGVSPNTGNNSKDLKNLSAGTYSVDGREVSDKDIDDFTGINDNGKPVGNGWYFGTRNKYGEPRRVNAGGGEILLKEKTVREKPEDIPNPFGNEYPDPSMPITADWQRNLSSLAPALEGLMNFNMTGMNHGIINPAAQMRLNQTYFDPRRQTIDDMTNNLLGITNRQAGLAKTSGSQGLAEALGARGQSGQMAKMIGDQVTAPAYQKQGEDIATILQNQWGAKDDLTAQQQDIDIMNMKSKAGFSDALRNDIVVSANLQGQRIWDSTMSNKYGWTPQQTGWVNAQLAALAHEYNMSEIELKFRLQKALDEANKESGWDSFMKGLMNATSIAALA